MKVSRTFCRPCAMSIWKSDPVLRSKKTIVTWRSEFKMAEEEMIAHAIALSLASGSGEAQSPQSEVAQRTPGRKVSGLKRRWSGPNAEYMEELCKMGISRNAAEKVLNESYPFPFLFNDKNKSWFVALLAVSKQWDLYILRTRISSCVKYIWWRCSKKLKSTKCIARRE